METLCRKFFNLECDPFGETPDPKYFFESPSHLEAITALLRFIGQGKGFGMLTGEVGTGKTLLSRLLLKSLDRDYSTALLLFPKLADRELLQTICEEFEIPGTPQPSESPSLKNYLDRLNEFVLQESARGRRCVLLVDEAQGLGQQALEAIRLLSDLETEREKLLQIILLGQPELSERLGRPELRQFAQRIGLCVELRALTIPQTERYIRHRLHIAGPSNLVRFDPKAIPLIHRATAGNPRQINQVCARLLSAAFEQRIRLIDQNFVRAAAKPARGGLLTRLLSRNPRNLRTFA